MIVKNAAGALASGEQLPERRLKGHTLERKFYRDYSLMANQDYSSWNLFARILRSY